MLRGVVLLTLESGCALEFRHIGNGRKPGGQNQLRWLQRDRLSLACHFHHPVLFLFIKFRRLAHRLCPVIQLHDLGVHFQPVTQLVLGRKNRPVIREWQIGHMVIPDRIMQAERLVTLAPAISRLLVLLDDDGGNTQPPEPRTQPNATLPATHNEAIRLGLVAEFLLFLVALFQPGRAVLEGPMHNTLAARRPLLFLVAFEFQHRRQQSPGLAVFQF